MSPRPGPRKPLIAIRLADAGLAWIDEQARLRGWNRSEMIRAMLAYAQQHMPTWPR
jgi:hypothetical protein